jgi:hypothetical protein
MLVQVNPQIGDAGARVQEDIDIALPDGIEHPDPIQPRQALAQQVFVQQRTLVEQWIAPQHELAVMAITAELDAANMIRRSAVDGR